VLNPAPVLIRQHVGCITRLPDISRQFGHQEISRHRWPGYGQPHQDPQISWRRTHYPRLVHGHAL